MGRPRFGSAKYFYRHRGQEVGKGWTAQGGKCGASREEVGPASSPPQKTLESRGVGRSTCPIRISLGGTVTSGSAHLHVYVLSARQPPHAWDGRALVRQNIFIVIAEGVGVGVAACWRAGASRGGGGPPLPSHFRPFSSSRTHLDLISVLSHTLVPSFPRYPGEGRRPAGGCDDDDGDACACCPGPGVSRPPLPHPPDAGPFPGGAPRLRALARAA
jgi:hypothetical protein